jgi:hypothetical protein
MLVDVYGLQSQKNNQNYGKDPLSKYLRVLVSILSLIIHQLKAVLRNPVKNTIQNRHPLIIS